MLSRRNKWMFAAAFVGMWGPLTVFGTHRTTLFVIYYQADVKMLSLIGIFAGLLDAVNGPFIASWADAGIANRLKCFPAAQWGRRAPLILLGTPLMIAGPVLMWLVPSKDDTAVALWYALCYFCVVNGVTVTLQSYLSSIQELFPTGDERALAVVRQTPFLVLTYILAGGLPVIIAFSSNPDESDNDCCVTPRYDCSEVPGCGCYVAPYLAPPNVTSPLSLLHPRYVSVCNSTALATTPLTTIGAQREEACSPGLAYGRFATVAAITFCMGVTAWLAVPPAKTSGATSAKTSSQPKLSFLHSVKTTFSQRPFQCYAFGMFLTTSWTTFLLTNLAIYLVYIADMEPAEIGQQYLILVVVVLIARVSMLPVYTKLLVKYPRHAHPARLMAYVKLVEAVVTPGFFLLLKVPDVSISLVLVLTGLVVGALQSPQDMCSHMLIGWAIDEDALNNGNQRREGMFYACNGVTQHLSQVLVNGILGIWGAVGFDSKRCASDQPTAATTTIELSFMLGLPLFSALNAAVLSAYPIQGSRLHDLQKRKEMATATLHALVGEDEGDDSQKSPSPSNASPSRADLACGGSDGEAADAAVEMGRTSAWAVSTLASSPAADAGGTAEVTARRIGPRQVAPEEDAKAPSAARSEAWPGTEGRDREVSTVAALPSDGASTDRPRGHARTSTWSTPGTNPLSASANATPVGRRGHRRTPSEPLRSSVTPAAAPNMVGITAAESSGRAVEMRAVLSALRAESHESVHSSAGIGMGHHARLPSGDVRSVMAALRSELV